MCGIAGLIAEKELVVREALAGMVRAEAHRGPDDSGEAIIPFGDRVLGLGHRRLSIIDLSAAGHQPMINPATGDRIVFNGEIYNFPLLRRELEEGGQRFVGHSDTEVLLYGLSRWGPEYLKRLQGMYALGFYHAGRRELLLARGPVGIKPLYVAQSGGRLLFASEVRGILGSGLVERKLDMRGVAGLLAYGAVQQPLTVFQGVKAFAPGAYQVFSAAENGAQRGPTQFWKYPGEARAGRMSEFSAVQHARVKLEAAVRDHLISDVPVGVFLSSGLDSTTMAALAAKHTSRLRSFSVGFADQPDMSELNLARQTAEMFGLEHTEIRVNGPDAQAAAVEWMNALDQPSVDGLNVYIISKMVRAQGIKVALSGQGGDELFGGYGGSFYGVPQLARWMRRTEWMGRGLRMALASLATAGRSEAVKRKFADMLRSGGSLVELYFQRRRAMDDAQLAELGLEAGKLGLSASFQDPEAMVDLPGPESDAAWAISQLESRFYQGNMLLRDADANGMAHGLEIRVPMLDQRVLELMLPLPGEVRLPNGRADKHILRDAMSVYFRPEILSQPKRGFTLPIRRWMVGPIREMCEEAIESLKQVGVLRAEGIDAVWRAFLAAPESPMWSRAFTLCVLGHYVKRMGAKGN